MRATQEVQKEAQRIMQSCPVLAKTGCTAQFCQAGRMTRPLEPLLGDNRSLSVIKEEAEAFLREMRNEGMFKNDDAFEKRLESVFQEIEDSAVQTKIWNDTQEEVDGVIRLDHVQTDGISSNGWVQTYEELQWGIRASWRNARKCIMRAHFEDLHLYDLRHITTSQGMIDAILKYLPEAFNGGRIQPSVFVFPPRGTNGPGPMLWSHQLLSFAGYEQEDGTILGDPANVSLTKDIIDILGWNPPEPRSRWDVLPIVAMAEGDEPAMGVLPPELMEPVSISHPDYEEGFEKLDLKWVKAPALSRPGFDIGGMQYTGSPFIGWFMDAEIGVRDLADSFRYNALPGVAQAIGWKNTGTDFEDLPSQDRLVWLSRAQAELNYAVHYSFAKAKVACINSLAASDSWIAFDDQYNEEKGHRLPSDPYWIAPPQGSIIPVWHRGFAPNYQPKPMITKHRFDPVKVWKRRTGISMNGLAPISRPIDFAAKVVARERVHLIYCGTGETAQTVMGKVRRLLEKRTPKITLASSGTFNSADTAKILPNDIILTIVSTTGHGNIPRNGLNFFKRMAALKQNQVTLRYAVFGIGDSGYHQTFNKAAKSVNQFFSEINATPLVMDGAIFSDVSTENPPWTDVQSWWESVESALQGKSKAVQQHKKPRKLQHYAALKSYGEATTIFDKSTHKFGRVMKMSLDLGGSIYQEMDNIRVLPQNPVEHVDLMLSLLGDAARNAKITLPHKGKDIWTLPIREFLTEYVDILEPFSSFDWLNEKFPGRELEFVTSPVVQVIESLFGFEMRSQPTPEELEQILLSIPMLRPRCYSIASAPHLHHNSFIAEILFRVIPQGRFSDITISNLQSGEKLRFKLFRNHLSAPLLLHQDKPLISVACGTGCGPIRSLLHARCQKAEQGDMGGPISLFLGFQVEDKDAFVAMAEEATKHKVLDRLYLVPSNRQKQRVQDRFAEITDTLERKLCTEEGYLHLCGSIIMVNDVITRLSELLGGDIEEMLGDRLIKEVF